MIYPTGILPFEQYLRPKTVEEAVSLYASYGKEAKLLAGGTDLLPLMRNRTLVPKYVIDITGITALDYVRLDEEGDLRIGALATLKAVEQSNTVKGKYLLLCEAIHRMGTTQLRNMGTVVGNLCRASPSADSATPLLVLEASLKIAGPRGVRTMPLKEFFTGPGKTALDDGEIVTEIRVPKLPAGTGTAFLKLTRTAEDLAKVNVATALTLKNNICQEARIALGGVAPTPIRVKEAEGVLRDKKITDELIELAAGTAADETRTITDVRSTAEYRKEISSVLVRRAIKLSWERARGKRG